MEFWLCNEDLNSTRFIRNIADICYHGSYLEAGGEIVTIGYKPEPLSEDIIIYQTNSRQHCSVFQFYYLDHHLIGRHDNLIDCKLSFTTLDRENSNYHHAFVTSSEITLFYHKSKASNFSDNWYQEGF